VTSFRVSDGSLVQSSDLGDAPMKSDCGKLFGAPSLRLLSIINGLRPEPPFRVGGQTADNPFPERSRENS
jgi:hypothetical protein